MTPFNKFQAIVKNSFNLEGMLYYINFMNFLNQVCMILSCK